MLRPTKKFHFLALMTVGVLVGLVAMAAPPEQLPTQVSFDLPATDGAQSDRSICQDDAVEDMGIGLESLMDVETQVGQPCCQALCEQICGIGEACLCKRCLVLGCGL